MAKILSLGREALKRKLASYKRRVKVKAEGVVDVIENPVGELKKKLNPAMTRRGFLGRGAQVAAYGGIKSSPIGGIYDLTEETKTIEDLGEEIWDFGRKTDVVKAGSQTIQSAATYYENMINQQKETLNIPEDIKDWRQVNLESGFDRGDIEYQETLSRYTKRSDAWFEESGSDKYYPLGKEKGGFSKDPPRQGLPESGNVHQAWVQEQLKTPEQLEEARTHAANTYKAQLEKLAKTGSELEENAIATIEEERREAISWDADNTGAEARYDATMPYEGGDENELKTQGEFYAEAMERRVNEEETQKANIVAILKGIKSGAIKNEEDIIELVTHYVDSVEILEIVEWPGIIGPNGKIAIDPSFLKILDNKELLQSGKISTLSHMLKGELKNIFSGYVASYKNKLSELIASEIKTTIRSGSTSDLSQPPAKNPVPTVEGEVPQAGSETPSSEGTQTGGVSVQRPPKEVVPPQYPSVLKNAISFILMQGKRVSPYGFLGSLSGDTTPGAGSEGFGAMKPYDPEEGLALAKRSIRRRHRKRFNP